MKIDSVIIKISALCIILSFLFEYYRYYHPLSAIGFFEDPTIKLGFKLFSVNDSKELLPHDIYTNERKCIYLDPSGYKLIWDNHFQYNSSRNFQQLSVESNRNGPESQTKRNANKKLSISQSKYKISNPPPSTFSSISNFSAFLYQIST